MADSTRCNTIDDAYKIIMERSKQNLLTGCREWFGHVHYKGYGCIRRDRKMHKVHRVVWEYLNGEIPEGKHVLHACDNPSCVEVIHLFLGTNQENIADKMSKDRSGKKLCMAKVAEIKSLLKGGRSQKEIGTMFGVHQSTIGRINTGARWNHVQAC